MNTITNSPFTGNLIHPIRLICLTLALSKWISYPLWFSERNFPLSPVSDLFLHVPGIIHIALLISSVICLLLLMASPKRSLLMVLILSELFSCLLDQNRWQPWEYVMLFMLAIPVWAKNIYDVKSGWKLIISGMYVFSGLYKINEGFVHDTWQNLILIRWMGITDIPVWLLRCGYLPGIVEMLAGLGLLFSQSRTISKWILVAMHVFILLLIGPSGLSLNVIVWPWNLLMMFLLMYLFHKKELIHTLSFHPKIQLYAILAAWWIMPWFYMTGHWDAYLSSALYGGNTTQLFICSDNAELLKTLSAFQKRSVKGIPCTPVISVYQWGINEMNIVPYPEIRNYKRIAVELNEKYPGNNKYYLLKSGFSQRVEEMQ